jgi:hypothetical protein
MVVIAGERLAKSQQTAASEGSMNEKCGGGGPNWGLLLLVPAALILTKGAMHRRAMVESAWGPASGGAGRGYGHHARFGGGASDAEEPGAFRLPPKIEGMLDTWHTRAHQTAQPTEPPTA